MGVEILFVSFFSILAILILYDLIRSIKLDKYKKIWILIIVDSGLLISIFIIMYLSLMPIRNINSVEPATAYLIKTIVQFIGLILALARTFVVDKLKKDNGKRKGI